MTQLINDPSQVHSIPEYDIELCSREVVELIATAAAWSRDDKRGLHDVGEKLLRYVAEVYKRQPLIANACINAYVIMGGDLVSLIRVARLLKHDPDVGAYLRYLKANLIDLQSEEAKREGRLLVRRSEERACMWAGFDAQQTRRHLRLFE